MRLMHAIGKWFCRGGIAPLGFFPVIWHQVPGSLVTTSRPIQHTDFSKRSYKTYRTRSSSSSGQMLLWIFSNRWILAQCTADKDKSFFSQSIGVPCRCERVDRFLRAAFIESFHKTPRCTHRFWFQLAFFRQHHSHLLTQLHQYSCHKNRSWHALKIDRNDCTRVQNRIAAAQKTLFWESMRERHEGYGLIGRLKRFIGRGGLHPLVLSRALTFVRE